MNCAYLLIVFICSLSKPFHIAEILSVWKVFILWIHSDTGLERAGFVSFYRCFEDIVVAVLANYVERMLVNNIFLSVIVCLYNNDLQSDSVIKALLINDISYFICLAGNHSC